MPAPDPSIFTSRMILLMKATGVCRCTSYSIPLQTKHINGKNS